MKKQHPGLLAEVEAEALSDGALASTLRKCIVLGGKAGSEDLRAWASRELKGYGEADEVPEYRTVGAAIHADAFTGGAIVKRQHIGAGMLPEFVRDDVDETLTFRQGVGQLEALIDQAAKNGYVDIAFPMVAEIGHLMDQASGNPAQRITALYWTVSEAALRGIVDHVRTALVELVAEMRAATPASAALPTGQAADQAVNIAVHGRRSKVEVNTAQSTAAGGDSTATVSPPDGPGWWTRQRIFGAGLAGLASIVGAALGIAQWQGWL